MKRALILLCLLATPAQADWVKIGGGPTLKVAMAYCENAAMGLPSPAVRSYSMVGNNIYVNRGGLLGLAIGASQRNKYQRNCMIIQGWEWREPVGTAPKKKQNWTGSKG